MTWFITPQLMQQYRLACEKSPCLPEQVEESSADISSGGKQSAPSKSRRTPGKSCSPDRPTELLNPSPSGTTSVLLTDALGEAIVTWFREDFLARMSARPEKVPVLTAKDQDSGARWRGSSVRCNPDGSGWKIAHCWFPEDLSESSVTLPRWGIVVRGDVWEPGKSVPRIVEIDSGSSEIVSAQSNVRVPWPTPMVTDAKNKGGKGQLRRKYPPLNAVVGIERSSKATEALAWPTPQSRDYKGAPGKGCVERGGHQSSLPMKIGQVTEALARPTPRSCTATAATITEQAQQCAADRFPNLETVMVQREHGAVGGALNPAWVEWLMNWPVGWTNLKPIRGFNRWRRKTMESSWWARDPADEPDTKVPRISVGKLHRVDRLKAIGNGQVPLCCALAFLTLQRELLTFLKNHPSGR